ncbi:MAG: hypothetical protein KAI35_08455 [Desulfobulbaceae bacterium]|nr:hypothetical protein [Desulfobulbaceae bacterium]
MKAFYLFLIQVLVNGSLKNNLLLDGNVPFSAEKERAKIHLFSFCVDISVERKRDIMYHFVGGDF